MTRLQRGLTYVALGVSGMLLAGCGSEAPPIVQSEPPVVTVSLPLKEDITDFDYFTGRVEAAESVEIRSRVRGELTGIFFKDGDIVEKGKPLFEIDPRVYQAALDVANAKKANAEASRKLAETEYARTYRLYQQNASTAQDVEVWTAKKGIALAELKQAEAEIARAQLDVDFSKIAAPITGKISRALVTKGNLVNTAGAETLLTTIVSVDPMYVYFDVDETSLNLYRDRRAKELNRKPEETKEIPASLKLGTDKDWRDNGKIDFADNRINPGTGTIRVRAVFPNEKRDLTPGQFARVKLQTGEEYKALLVNDQAIATDQAQKYVLVVNNENKVEYRLVEPGGTVGDLRIFREDSGLKADDLVIVNGAQRVRPGIVVKPEKVDMPTLKGAGDGKKGDDKKADDKKPKT